MQALQADYIFLLYLGPQVVWLYMFRLRLNSETADPRVYIEVLG
jgi:hypothetical protein